MIGIEAHFDESGTDGAELTVAGYLFEASRIEEFCRLWSSVLDEYSLPFFHMVDCAGGAKPYDKLDKTERIKLQMKLMRLIKRFAVNGIVCNIKNDKANREGSYANAAELAVRQVVEWADATANSEPIAYFFEAGAPGHGMVGNWLNEVAHDATSKAFFHYAGHSFVPKEGNPGVQAADLLAWQYHNFTKKRAKQNLARLDLRALLRHPHRMVDFCGDPPRNSKTQSVPESRRRIETVYYLAKAAEHELQHASILRCTVDTPAILGNVTGVVLACPQCLRAVAEDFSMENLAMNRGERGVFAIQCWCGTPCRVPDFRISR